MEVYKLQVNKPYSKFRLGIDDLGDSADHVYSDTLFSALVNIHAQINTQESTDRFIQAFKSGEIKISSVFYGLKGENGSETFFFPRPSLPFKDELYSPLNRKKYKRLRWVSQDLLKQLLLAYDNNEKYLDWQLNDEQVCYDVNRQYLLTNKEFSELFHKDKDKIIYIPAFNILTTSTKVAINRANGGAVDGALYYQTDLTIPSYLAGLCPFLFFLTEIEASWKAEFNTCIRLLADTGIGGERSTGCGQFAGVQIAPFEALKIEEKHGLQYTLSLISPKQEEVSYLNSYTLIRRGGLDTHEETRGSKIPSLNMLKEGAIADNKLKGQLKELSRTGSHTIYRNGISFGINF